MVVSFDVTFSATCGGVAKDEYYHGCQKCYDFSIAFGGNTYKTTEEDEGYDYPNVIPVNTEENFELVKGLFVAHFNKYHKDIIRNREKDTRIYNKKSKRNTMYNTDNITSGTVNLFGSSTFHELYLVSTPNNTGTINSVFGAMIPEYETISEVNPNNLDRNERFRARYNTRRYRD